MVLACVIEDLWFVCPWIEGGREEAGRSVWVSTTPDLAVKGCGNWAPWLHPAHLGIGLHPPGMHRETP